MYVYLNSRLIPARAAMVPVFDRGFAYGDGLFETLKILDGRPVFFDEHFERLQESMDAAGFEASLDSMGLMNQALLLAEANKVTDGRLRIQLTRGTPPEPGGPDPGPDLSPTLLITADSFTGYPDEVYSEGISCRTVPVNRGRYAAIKTTSLLATILAREEAHSAGAQEAILTSGHGSMLEGSISNIFFKIGGSLVTAPKTEKILAGVVRGKIIDIVAELGKPVEYLALKAKDLDPTRMSAYLTSSMVGICPVKEIDGAPLKTDAELFSQLSSRLAALEEESIRD